MQKAIESASLREQATKCRNLANGINDPVTIATLRQMAGEYERTAVELDGGIAMDGMPHPTVDPLQS